MKGHGLLILKLIIGILLEITTIAKHFMAYFNTDRHAIGAAIRRARDLHKLSNGQASRKYQY